MVAVVNRCRSIDLITKDCLRARRQPARPGHFRSSKLPGIAAPMTGLKVDLSLDQKSTNGAFGSVLRIRAVERRSLARRGPPRDSPRAAVPRTPAIRASAVRRAQRPLGASQREYARHRPASADAALRTSRGRLGLRQCGSCCHPGQPSHSPASLTLMTTIPVFCSVST